MWPKKTSHSHLLSSPSMKWGGGEGSSIVAEEDTGAYCPHPNILHAGRRVTKADFALADRAVALDLAGTLMLPKDKEVLGQQTASVLRMNIFHHLIASAQHLLSAKMRHMAEIKEERRISEEERKICYEAKASVDKYKNEANSLRKSSKAKNKKIASSASALKKAIEELQVARAQIEELNAKLKKSIIKPR